ncbi:MAG: hypothetical protein RIR25_375, partial [Verrucomicrobiota bacterium]
MKTTSLRKTLRILPLALCFLANALVPHFAAAQSAATSTFSVRQEFKQVTEPVQPASEKIISSFSYSGKVARKGFKPT